MATEELLQAERGERPRMAILAGVAAFLTLAGSLVARVASGAPPDNLPAAMLFYHENQTTQYVSAACSAIGAVLIAIVLDFLYRATRARNPALPKQIRPLPWVGGIGVALFTLAYQIALGVNVAHFATEGSQTYEEARKAIEAGVPALLGLVVQLALALAIVMISINAMRVGLLTRFLGYLGVISGALFVLALVPIPIVQVYWLAALAMLFAGRSMSSGGIPPAWQSGEAMPWPSAAEMREQRVREAEARRGGGEPGGFASPSAEPDDAPAESQGQRRKRKKRR